MKKLAIILFIIGMFTFLVDVNNMTVFFATKIIGLALMIPAFLTIKFEEE